MNNKFPDKRRAFGQNFLIDDGLIQDIVNDMGAGPEDFVLEIGPGKGALTKILSEKCKSITAIEIDKKWASYLREKTSIKNLKVVQEDASRIQVPELLASHAYKREHAILVGNLPYNRTGPILNNFCPHLFHFRECQFMVQYEVGKRMVSPPGKKNYGSLSVFMQNYAEVELIRRIPPDAFRPRPKIFSAMVKLKPLSKPVNPHALFPFFVKQSFSQKRKKIVNSLSALISKNMLLTTLDKLNIPPLSRAEQLTLVQFSDLFNEVLPELNRKR